VKCEFRAEDWKRAPISHEYVAALEGRIAALESLLSSIKHSTGQERESIVDGIDFLDHLPRTASKLRMASDIEMLIDNDVKGYWTFDEEGSKNDAAL
jgi:hypothetical protein